MELLSWYLLRARHESFCAINLHNQRAAFISMRSSGDNFALAFGELLKEAVAFIFTKLLNHHLLSGLCRDSAKRF